AGTLNSSASGHVRMAVAGIIASSLGMPEAWHKSQFILWLRERGLEERLKKFVVAQGADWQFELNNIYVSKYISPGLIELDNSLGNDIKQVRSLIIAQFPQRTDISNQELIGFVEQALKLTYKGRIPFTLVVIDEVQQYAGTDHHRAVMVQEVLEALCSHFKGKLLIVGTGQSALRETSNLQRLMGRFPISIQLSETDVETVTRRVLLAKTPAALAKIEETVRKYEGEIARQLEGTAAGWLDGYRLQLANDYPLLPARRRFWDVVMQSVDTTGTGSQLRSQLDIVQKALQNASDEELGFAVPGDLLYDLISTNLIQLSSLPRSSHEEIQRLENGDANSRFKARIIKLVFLLNQIRSENPKGKGLQATQEIIIDLLISRLDGERNELTHKVPPVLLELVSGNLLQKLPSGEYCLQTPEGQAWVQEFQKQETALRQTTAWIDAELRSKIDNMALKLCRDIQDIPHGKCQIHRKVNFCFDSQPPKEAGLHVWIQNGRDSDLQIIKNEAAKAGVTSTTAFVFIPLWDRDELERALIELKAAHTTLGLKGIPVNDEGRNAKQSMENRFDEASRKVELLINNSLEHASVFAGGGIEKGGAAINENIRSVLYRALPVLYPKFDEADHASWGNAYDKAMKGQPDALSAVGHTGEIDTHPVCRQILSFIGSAGKKGDEIKKNFMGGQYGWEQEAIETALIMLLANGKIKVSTSLRKPLTINEWERRQYSSYEFKAEVIVLNALDLIQIRKFIQKHFDRNVQPQQEFAHIREVVDFMLDLSKKAGGEPPAPPVPKCDVLNQIRNEIGNAQLRLFLDNTDEIVKMKNDWEQNCKKLKERIPRWNLLKDLLEQGRNLLSFKELENEADTVCNARILLNEPDPLENIIKKASDALRANVNSTYQELNTVYTQEFEKT
ncbi:MAG TPA: BREX system P-loop protein BrxC, partial [Bacteroidales bacterium]|nr:BREX system P-loop protein BrxC [Bacteroidales bacterium]